MLERLVNGQDVFLMYESWNSRPELRQTTKSTKSQIKLNLQTIELKHTMAQERKQSGK